MGFGVHGNSDNFDIDFSLDLQENQGTNPRTNADPKPEKTDQARTEPQALNRWVQLALEYYIPEVSSYPDQRQDLLGLKQYLNHSANFPDRLVAAPTRHPEKFSIFAASIGSAWLS